MHVILKTTNLSKHYGPQKAVDNLDLVVKKGEIYGFLGRNGAGKTTTIRMLLGLIQPTRGDIEIFGESLRGAKKSILQRIGSTIEYPGFYPNLTGVENLRINAKLIGLQKESYLKEALEIVGLEEAGKKLVQNYSLGMKQRLGIARAILHHPELLILDEPTNGLDPVGIKEMRKLIKELAEARKITIFMSSHLLSEVQQLATTIGIIHQGNLLEEIPYGELMKRNRRYIELQVSNDERAAMLLEKELGIHDYKVLEERNTRIYSHYDEMGLINQILVQNQIMVTKLGLSEENLEDYFVSLTGGGSIA